LAYEGKEEKLQP